MNSCPRGRGEGGGGRRGDGRRGDCGEEESHLPGEDGAMFVVVSHKDVVNEEWEYLLTKLDLERKWMAQCEGGRGGRERLT